LCHGLEAATAIEWDAVQEGKNMNSIEDKNLLHLESGTSFDKMISQSLYNTEDRYYIL
jgi:hypothetical protein